VLWIHEDNLEILVCSILIDPIRIQNTQIGTLPPHSLFRRYPQTPLVLELIDTLIRGFAVRGSLSGPSVFVQKGSGEKRGFDLGDGTFAATATDTDAVDDIALLGLVAQATSLVRARGSGSAVDDVELAVFPAAHAEEEAEDIGLFVLIELCKRQQPQQTIKKAMGDWGLYPRGTCMHPWSSVVNK
jgi:hypothetical protein